VRVLPAGAGDDPVVQQTSATEPAVPPQARLPHAEPLRRRGDNSQVVRWLRRLGGRRQPTLIERVSSADPRTTSLGAPVTDPTDDSRDIAESERKLREHEEEARDRDRHERPPREGDTPGGADRPAPPGPESQQPRG
jgi:hypothetical protein